MSVSSCPLIKFILSRSFQSVFNARSKRQKRIALLGRLATVALTATAASDGEARRQAGIKADESWVIFD